MAIEFYCPQCKALLQTPDDSAGMECDCPHCDASMMIPNASMTGEVNQEIPEPPTPSSSGIPPKKQKKTTQKESTGQAFDFPLQQQTGSITSHSQSRSIANIYLSDRELQRVMRPAPRESNIVTFLSFGWAVMRRNFQVFLVAGLIAGLTSLFSGFTLIGPFVLGPILLAGMGAIAVRAARGLTPKASMVFIGFQDFGNVFIVMFLWGMTLAAAHMPLVLVAGVLFWLKLALLKVIGILIVLGGGIFFGIRLGWVPFIILERPNLPIHDVLAYSIDISRGRSLELIQVVSLAYAAIFATVWLLGIGLFVIGLPLAMGIGGGTYVLLTRDHAR